MRIIFTMILCVTAFFGLSQQKVSHLISESYNRSVHKTDLFTSHNSSRYTPDFLLNSDDYMELQLDRQKLTSLQTTRPQSLYLSLPTPQGYVEFTLIRNDATKPFPVYTYDGEHKQLTDHSITNLHYIGTVKNQPASLVSFSVINEELRIIYGAEEGNINIGKIKGSERYAYLPTASADFQRPGCDSELLEKPVRSPLHLSESEDNAMAPGDCVQIYFEMDYQSYLDNGSDVGNTTSFMQGLFNEIATLYLNESIEIGISEIMVWTEPDIYTHTAGSVTILNEFQTKIDTEDFNGDLAHLVSTYNGNRGGLAYLDVLCFSQRQYQIGFSEIHGSYNSVPTYSWDVEVITHELGHNFGSPHTHQCVWNGNNTQIDDCGNEYSPSGAGACYNSASPIIPAAGGTIMSYCHLLGGVGIDFNNGFGVQPGDLIRDRYNNASCLTACCEFSEEADLGEDIFTCEESVTLDAGVTGVNYDWSTGETTQTIQVTESGTYSVEISDDCGNDTDEVFVEFGSTPEINLNEQYEYCGEPVTVDATTSSAISYEWSTGEVTASIEINSPGDYWVEVTNDCGVTHLDFTVSEATSPELDLGEDFTLCESSSIDISIPIEGESYLWSTGETTQTITIYSGGEYWAEVQTNCGVVSDTIDVEEQNEPIIFIPGIFQLCEGGTLTVHAGSMYADSFLWSTGETTESIDITEPGDYWVQAFNDCGQTEQIFHVELTDEINLDFGPDAVMCEGESYELDMSNIAANTYIWSTGETTPTITVTEPGLYWGEVDTDCGFDRDTIIVESIAPPLVSADGDFQICSGEATTITSDVQNVDSFVWSTGETTATITITSEGDYWLEGSNDCGTDRYDFSVTADEHPAISLGPDLSICAEEEVELTIPDSGGSYLWSTGETTQTISVNQEGEYWGQLTTNCGTVRDTVYVEVIGNPEVAITGNLAICEGEVATVIADVLYTDEILWSTGETTPSIEISEAGNYWLRGSNSCATETHEFSIEVEDLPVFSLGPDFVLCEGDEIQLQIPVNGTSYLWSTGETTSTISVSSPGTYWGEVNTNCGTVRDTLEIQSVAQPTLSLSGNVDICEGDAAQMTANFNYAEELLWSTGETTQTIEISEEGEYWVQAANQCFTVQENFTISYKEQPVIPFDDSYLLCDGEEIVLDATNEGATYLWQDGSTEATFLATEEGTYSVQVNLDDCVEEKQTTIQFIEPLSVELGKDTIACLRDEIYLEVDVEPGQSVMWNDGSETSVFVATETGRYTVQLSNICETVADQIFIEFYECCVAQVPTAFSPDSSGKNDIFRPLFNCKINDYRFKIFNRWGEKVFESTQLSQGWDGTFHGTKALPDAYTWALEYFDEETNQTRVFKGVVNLIR